MEFMRFFDLSPETLKDYVAERQEYKGLWFFQHIPKTAGSSLAAELGQHFQPFENLFVGYSEKSDRVYASLDERLDGFLEGNPFASYRTASGHFVATQIDRVRAAVPGVKMFTFLRHPVYRTVSEYNYCCTPLHPPHEEFKRRYPTLRDYVADPAEGNKMALYLFGANMPTDPEEIKDRLAERFDFIGIQERYPISFLMLTAMLGKPMTPTARERVQSSGAKTKPDEETLRAIVAANAIDVSIYTMVSEVFGRISDSAWDLQN